MAADCAVWKLCTVARLDFDRKQLKVVQGKAKDRYVPLSEHLIRLKKYIEAENLRIIF
jgi:integrase